MLAAADQAPGSAMITASLTIPDRSLLGVITTPLPLSQLAHPLDYLLAEHMRLRAVCSLLRYAGETCELEAKHARAVTEFITHFLPLHREDEECDLFPAVLKSARRDDELVQTISNLEVDHHRMTIMQGEIVRSLACSSDRDVISLSASTARMLCSFADAERRHVAIENGIVLAIARTRIHAKGLAEIAQAMTARRGL